MLARFLDWIKRIGNSSNASRKICQRQRVLVPKTERTLRLVVTSFCSRLGKHGCDAISVSLNFVGFIL